MAMAQGIEESMRTASLEQSEQQRPDHGYPLDSIMRLPPEMLSAVFEIYRVIVWATRSSSWTQILHVCKLWREVAFSTPGLWMRIESTSLDFVECAITHSGSLPLDFVGVSQHDTAVRLRILKELPRIRTLLLMLTPDILDFLYSEEVASSATPLLETLSLNFTHDDEEDMPTLPPFSDAPLFKLRTLAVQNGSFFLVRSLIRPMLHTLAIASPTPMPCSIAEIVELLANLPLLQNLSLYDAVFHPFADTDEVPQVARTLKLPRLSHIALHEYWDGRVAAYLFAHLGLTEDARVEFHAEDIVSLAKRFLALDSFMPSALTPDGWPFRPRSIELRARITRVAMRLWTLPFIQWKYRTPRSVWSAVSEEPKVAVHLDICNDTSHITPTIHKLFEHISLSWMTSLSLTGSYTHKLEMSHLVEMKWLDTLLLRGSVYPSSLVEALCGPVPLAEIGPVDFVLPNLKNLELSGVRWRVHPDDIESAHWWHLIESLRCRARYALQLGIYQLTITHPGNLFSADIREMWHLGAADRYAIDPQGYRTDDKPPSPLETPAWEP